MFNQKLSLALRFYLGFAYVEFAELEAVEKSMDLEGTKLRGRTIKV